MSTTIRPPDQERGIDPDGLAALVGRVAQADRDAFTRMYETLSPAVITSLRGALLNPADVTAVAAATFIEVWWLARHHTDRATDVYAWVIGIATRRTSEHLRSSAALHTVALTAIHDQHTELVLTGLLNANSSRPVGRGDPRSDGR
jgi:DNA-directed RNA polymerase specialized sigma24 family protein